MVSLDLASIGYFPEPDNNRMKYFPQEDVKILYVADTIFLSLPVTKKASLLHQIVAFNDNYILTNRLNHKYNTDHLFIFDWNYNIVLEATPASHMPKDRENVLNIVKTRFGDCSELLEMVTKNKNEKYKWRCPLDNIASLKCGEKDFLKTLPK